MILSIDYGTSSLKIALLNDGMEPVYTDKESYDYVLLPGEKVEISPDTLIQALARCCDRMGEERRRKVEVVCYDSFSPSLMLMDKEGEALYPVVTHMDRRSRLQSGTICERVGKERYQAITGVYPFTGGVSLTSLLWFMQEMPELCRDIYHIGHLPTFLHKKLTGEWVVDSVNATMTGLYDTVGQSGWSKELQDSFGVPGHWLPEVVQPGVTRGSLLPAMASLLGLRAGVPVAVGTNDVVATHAGAGNSRAGQVLNVAGSSDMISILTDVPATDPGYYLRGAGRPGLWQVYATTSGGFAVEWFRGQFCREMDEEEFYHRYLPGCIGQCDGTEVSFAPYLAEDRQSLERKKGAFGGLGLGSTREQMLAALLRDMQGVLAGVLRRAETRVNTEKTIKVAGGFASPDILRLKECAFHGYNLLKVEDCTLRGNGILAAGAKPAGAPEKEKKYG